MKLLALPALLLPLLAQAPQKPAVKPPASQPAAQTPPTVDDRPITLDVTRVNFLFTVSDKKGRFVTDLKKDDFEIVESKKQQNILEFVAESDLPLRLAVLVDTSNSIRDRFKFLQEAAVEFINSAIRPERDKAIVVSFDSGATLVADLTGKTDVLAKAVRDLRPGGGTSLYDAIYFACRDKLAQDQPRHKYRRALVVLSDGDDNQSRFTREQALEMAHKADVVLYAVSTNNTRLESDGDKVLRYLTRETGGVAFFPFKAEDLAQSFENIANELRNQYSILYRPEPLKTDGLFHKVEIKVRDRKELVVRARNGYFAPKF